MYLQDKAGRSAQASVLLRGGAPAAARAPLLPVPTAETDDFEFHFPSRRRRLWDLHSNLHCSIIGTCFSNDELRQLLRRIDGVRAEGSSEHDLHSRAVGLAGRQGIAAKLLHKALDRKFKGEIVQFETATDAESLLRCWRAALNQGDIPGAYWAVLTHPAATDEVVREVFGEVHMLSHLVGATSRADIRRLRQLEEENATLKARLEQQDRELRESLARRDRSIRELKLLLESALGRARRNASRPEAFAGVEASTGAFGRKPRRERGASLVSREKFAKVQDALATECKLRQQAERRAEQLQREVEALEAVAQAVLAPPEATNRAGMTVLYAGGRQNQISHLKRLAEKRGAEFLHHDGGIEEASALLPSLVAQADAIFFPVDCISHSAVTLLKAVCRQLEKPYVPLRSSGLSSFAAALSSWAAIVGEHRSA